MNPNGIFLCVSVLCITSIAASYNYGHPLLVGAKTGSKGLPQLHSIHKRQADSGVCPIGISIACTDGYFEDFAYLYFRCNFTEAAVAIREQCSSNSRDDICASLEPDSVRFQSMCGSSPTTCTPECRDFLTSTRAQLGCCVNILNETTINGGFEIGPFDYSLWSLCGVEQVTEQCTPSFDLPTEIDPTCNILSSSTLQMLYSGVFCRAEFVEPLLNTAATEGCEEASETIRTSCTVNEQGQYCGTLGNDLDSYRASTFANCVGNTACNSLCTDTLNSITNTAGCCSIDENFGYSVNLWQQCGLTSPGSCEVRFTSGPRITDINAVTVSTATTDSSAVILKGSGKTITSVVGLFMVVLIYPNI